MDTEGILLRFDGLFRGVQEEMEEDKDTIETVNSLMVVVSAPLTTTSATPNTMSAIGGLHCWRPSFNYFVHPQSPSFYVAEAGKFLRLCRANARDQRDFFRCYPFGFPPTQGQKLYPHCE